MCWIRMYFEFVWSVVFTRKKVKFEKLIEDTLWRRIRKARGFSKVYENMANFDESSTLDLGLYNNGWLNDPIRY